MNGPTVADLIERLRALPPSAPVYVWDGDNAQFVPVDLVSAPSREAAQASGLPAGAVVVWGA